LLDQSHASLRQPKILERLFGHFGVDVEEGITHCENVVSIHGFTKLRNTAID